MLKVGLLLHHDLTHLVPHAAPYAFELSRKHPDIEVVIVCTSRPVMRFVKRIETLYPDHRCQFKMLSLSWAYILKRRIHRKRLTRWKVIKCNLDFFRRLDALVAPERNFSRLRTQYGIKDLLLINTRHGAGDSEAGLNDQSGVFDLTLLPGQKYVNRLKELHYLEEGKYAVVGYPKFEVSQRLDKEKKKFFQNNNPVVVYNPHFNQAVSSWAGMGLEVLEFFKKHPNWNLIFAPHVVLFNGLFRGGECQDGFLLKEYYKVPNIHINLGSSSSTDMTYMFAANVYLGDVNSQVYEFLLEKRPCIFLNAHGVNWQDNAYYLHWGFGLVINNVNLDLKPALNQVFSTQQQYLQKQQDIFDYTFYADGESTAAERGAKAIAEFLL